MQVVVAGTAAASEPVLWLSVAVLRKYSLSVGQCVSLSSRNHNVAPLSVATIKWSSANESLLASLARSTSHE